jgi:hypothetical protein
MTSSSLSCGIDLFPKLVFVDNKDDRRLDVTLNGVETAEDLFQFFVNLLTRGIVMLYGQGTQSVQIDNLDDDQLAFLVRKFRNLGVLLKIDVKEQAPASLGAVFVVDKDKANDISGYTLKLTDVRRSILVNFSWI